ncbi:hypothetical protein, partial [Stenotrophomonas sp. GbtcB23]|uniref:hypothetical protein n=1 Tax=Stenotrophomonas sp. GbtcB23 TaxID=2824768 RepID=UPI001C303EA1
GLVAKEVSELIPRSLDVLRNSHGIGFSDLAKSLLVSPDFLKQIVVRPEDDVTARRAALRNVH